MNLSGTERIAVVALMIEFWDSLDEHGQKAFCKLSAGDDRQIFKIRDLSNNEVLEWKLFDVLFAMNRGRPSRWLPYIAGDLREGWEEFSDDYELLKIILPKLEGVCCARCKTAVESTDVDGYFAYCSNHDEDLYEFETEKINAIQRSDLL